MNNDVLIEVLFAIIAAIAVGSFAILLHNNKQRLLEAINSLVQKAEETIEGSKMGEEKKKRVLAQLETMGFKITAHVSELVDIVVAKLNETQSWLTDSAKTKLSLKSGKTDE